MTFAPYRIRARAPIRICDCGGWTDTWFAGHGVVFNIGIAPFAHVEIDVLPRASRGPQILVHAEDFGARFETVPGKGWPHHPIIEASIERMAHCIPAHAALEIALHCEAPAGASTGTSASVTVALLAAMTALGGHVLQPHTLAYAAHQVETQMLGRQSGIQDQLCAAYGGINLINMADYPNAQVQQLALPQAVNVELEQRLALIFIGKSHDSSAVHEKVIRELENAGPSDPRIELLRTQARAASTACSSGDFAALGRAMSANTEAQACLNPALVSRDARAIMDIAQAHHALGYKVNGAGGDGGSITLLTNGPGAAKRAMLRDIVAQLPRTRNIPLHLSAHGVQAWRIAQ